MVLRGILARRRNDLQLFRASARLTGFANQLAMLLDELQRHEITPDQLEATAAVIESKALSLKLRDVAMLCRDYTLWLDQRGLKDASALLTIAAAELRKAPVTGSPMILSIWADGFADLSAQEASFLAAVARHTGSLTVTFCLRAASGADGFWLSIWAAPEKSLERCRKMFVETGLDAPSVETLGGGHAHRFAHNPVLAHIERHWPAPKPYHKPDAVPGHVRVVSCADPEAEAREAAREIVRHARVGGRFRDVAVLARQLGPYAPHIKRVFSQYDIPCFIDRREDVSHHPFAELTRSALRTVVFDWRPEDWFSALKTGLVPAANQEIDDLENEALARGWRGEAWKTALEVHGDTEAANRIQQLCARIMPPFNRLHRALTAHPKGLTGPEMASALRAFWKDLDIENRLSQWVEGNKEGVLTGESHMTVWNQVNDWLGDVEMAFSEDRLTLREWMPVLDAGLSALTIGVIPPALDQVLAGAIDRSRNCEARLVILLGMNETVFPGGQEQSALFSDADRKILGGLKIAHAGTTRAHLSRERHLGYLAFTRASNRLVTAFSARDNQGAVLNPSPFLSQLQSLFPGLEFEQAPAERDWKEAEHANELVLPALLRAPSASDHPPPGALAPELLALKPVAGMLERVATLRAAGDLNLSAETARSLYGPTLRTSVSRMEQFAACPFRFFVNSGLDARERAKFELDAREKGSFQHEVLATFHNQLSAEGKRWRDITPAEARERIASIAHSTAESYRDRLMQSSDQTRFTALLITEFLQDFVETMVGWMRSQYQFNPVAAELGFGGDGICPAWDLDLGDGLKLSLQGRIDRVDICKRDGEDGAYCVVTDYKSGQKKLDDVLIEHGLQLQLLSYLNVLARWEDAAQTLGVGRLLPAGVFYVSLRGDYKSGKNRSEVLSAAPDAKKAAYKHTGRFDAACLPLLDSRNLGVGDQFAFKINKTGEVSKVCKDPMTTAGFAALLSKVEGNLVQMGARIYSGETALAPYRKGSETACRHCDYISVCRSDPWTQVFRALKKSEEEEP
jgi:ATP-dependent helicase/nuclease subunit B